MNIGILGAASIALNRFLPSLSKIEDINCVGIAARDPNSLKLKEISEKYGIKIYNSYEDIISDKNIDAIYIPLPPALHFEWAKKALLNGKHVLSEKPATVNTKEITELVNLAKEKNLALYENYMFVHHKQLLEIKKVLKDEIIGDLRLIRATFSFPKRENNDFRYNKTLGGGALLDAGGYVIKLASELLGDTMKIVTSNLVTPNNEEVDIYGSFSAKNNEGLVYQGSFGMDNNYQCSLEIFAQKGKILTERIFTAGSDFNPSLKIFTNEGIKEILLPVDDHFMNSINYFKYLTENIEKRNREYDILLKQAKYVEKIKENSYDLF